MVPFPPGPHFMQPHFPIRFLSLVLHFHHCHAQIVTYLSAHSLPKRAAVTTLEIGAFGPVDLQEKLT